MKRPGQTDLARAEKSFEKRKIMLDFFCEMGIIINVPGAIALAA